MAIAPTDRGPVLQAVHRALEARAPFAGTVGDESTGMGVFAREAPQWLADPASADAVEALAVHTYDNPNAATRNAARDVARQHDKPLWSTEICCNVTGANNYGKLYDPSMGDGLWMANTIASDILDAGASAFDWWQAVSGALGCDPTQDAGCPERAHFGKDAYNDGLLYINPRYGSQDDHRFWITKRFYVLGQFSRFVRPGAVRHEVVGTPPHIRVLAFQNGRDWQLVVLDNDPPGVSGTEVRLRLPAGRLKASAAYQTSETRSLERVDPARVQPDGTVVAHVPAQSVTTFTLRGE
jgi:O-glycosyl hydrolase